MGTIEPWGYGSYNATTAIISLMEVVIDPPPCACQGIPPCRTHKRSGGGLLLPCGVRGASSSRPARQGACTRLSCDMSGNRHAVGAGAGGWRPAVDTSGNPLILSVAFAAQKHAGGGVCVGPAGGGGCPLVEHLAHDGRAQEDRPHNPPEDGPEPGPRGQRARTGREPWPDRHECGRHGRAAR